MNGLRMIALMLVWGVLLTFQSSETLAAQNSTQATLVQPDKNEEKEALAYFQKQDWVQASKAYQVLAERYPSSGRVWYRLGYAFHSMGKYDQAIQALKKSVEIGKNPLVMYNLACAYAKANDPNHAFEWLNQAAQAGFSQPQQISSDEDLISLHSDARFKEAVALVDKNVNPCKYTPEFRQFDFWVGEWTVQNPKGQTVGSSSVQRILGDCVLFENWTGAGGGQGKSFNIYNTSTGKWQQTWVDQTGTVIEFSGECKNGVLQYVGEKIGTDHSKTLNRMTFTKLPEDRVHQVWEQSTDDGKTWTTAFDGIYIRKK